MKNCYRNVATITNLFFVYLLIILHNVTKSNEVLFSIISIYTLFSVLKFHVGILIIFKSFLSPFSIPFLHHFFFSL